MEEVDTEIAFDSSMHDWMTLSLQVSILLSVGQGTTCIVG